jgi:hypothetical protein
MTIAPRAVRTAVNDEWVGSIVLKLELLSNENGGLHSSQLS